MGYTPEENTLNEYLALASAATWNVRRASVAKYPRFLTYSSYVGFVYFSKKTVFFFNFLYHLFFLIQTPCLLFEYCAVKPAHNETTGTGFLSVAGKVPLNTGHGI